MSNAELVPVPGDVTEAEGRMEASRPHVRLCNCGGCGAALLGRREVRRVRQFPEAVRRLFPDAPPAGKLPNGRPACPACLGLSRAPSPHPAPFGRERSR